VERQRLGEVTVLMLRRPAIGIALLLAALVLVVPGCGSLGSEGLTQAVLPTRGASGWSGPGNVLVEGAVRSVALVEGHLVYQGPDCIFRVIVGELDVDCAGGDDPTPDSAGGIARANPEHTALIDGAGRTLLRGEDVRHPHFAEGALFHTCGNSICRDGEVILAPDEGERSVRDPFVRTVVSPLGRELWDMWFVLDEDGDGNLAFAGSFDGLTWVRYADNPILSPTGGVASPWIEEEFDGTALYVVTRGDVVRRVRTIR